MRISRLALENWRNFLKVNVPLERRAFIVGPNASGKSNLLDAIRFLRDIADPQGGLQRAVHARRGVSQIRSLHARRNSYVAIKVALDPVLTPTMSAGRARLADHPSARQRIQISTGLGTAFSIFRAGTPA